MYKHYTGSQALLHRIVERLNEMDYEHAVEYGMPETELYGFVEYLRISVERLPAYRAAWLAPRTKAPFSTNFRKMLNQPRRKT